MLLLPSDDPFDNEFPQRLHDLLERPDLSGFRMVRIHWLAQASGPDASASAVNVVSAGPLVTDSLRALNACLQAIRELHPGYEKVVLVKSGAAMIEVAPAQAGKPRRGFRLEGNPFVNESPRVRVYSSDDIAHLCTQVPSRFQLVLTPDEAAS